jgi:LmbE family N-acetylglucosaminyl deacetylase
MHTILFFVGLVGSLCQLVAAGAQSVPLPLETWVGKRVMFIYAHIDDMEASSGGLVKRLSDAGGADVHLLIMTNGDKGCSNDAVCGNASNAELAEIRQQEQYHSAELLNIPLENIYFLGYEDVLLKMYSRVEISKKIVSLIRFVKPHVVMTWDLAPHLNMLPSTWSDLGYHPDHQYSGELTLDTVWQAELSRLWPELGAAWRVQETYQWAYNPEVVPSHYVDITGAPLTAKTEAFLQMKSQYNQPSDITSILIPLALMVAKTCQLPDEITAAEGYQYILW